MARKCLLLASVIALLIVAVPVQAQEAELQCSDEQIAEAVATANNLLAGGGYTSTIDARSALSALDSVCLGLDFEGSAPMVSDFVYVPAGLYRVTVTGDTFFIMDTMVIEGECGPTGWSSALFNEDPDSVSQGAESLFESEGCTVIWEISNISGAYTVEFEKMK